MYIYIYHSYYCYCYYCNYTIIIIQYKFAFFRNYNSYYYTIYISTYDTWRVFCVITHLLTYRQSLGSWMLIPTNPPDAFESRRANRLLAVPGDPSRKRCSPDRQVANNGASAGRSRQGNLEIHGEQLIISWKIQGLSHENGDFSRGKCLVIQWIRRSGNA